MEDLSEIRKACPVCGRLIGLGHSHKGVVRFNLSAQWPANVWACEYCWYEEAYQAESEEPEPAK